jgi:hypothetical protein
MENNLSISEIMQEDGHLNQLPSWEEVASVLSALTTVTGEDSFLLVENFTLAYGDDYEKPVTPDMWEQVGDEANLITQYAKDIALEWCHIKSGDWTDLS